MANTGRPVHPQPTRRVQNSAGAASANKTHPGPQPSNNGPAGPRKKKNGRVKAVLLVFLKVFVLAGCVAIIAGCILGVYMVKYVVETTKDDNIVLDLESLSRPQTGYVWATDPDTGERFVYQKLVGEQNSLWIAFQDIPQQMIDAIISVEDQHFYEHSGVNIPRTILAALNSVFKFQSTFGASTIDQQLIKNLTGENELDNLRKLREIFRAWGLNQQYSKDMILEAYLNTLPLSGTIVGVQAGAKEYFNKDLQDCTLPEFALLAGITQAPGRYNPLVNPENALKRRNVVLGMMLDNDKITQAEYDWAVAQPLGINQPEQTEQQEAAAQVNDYFMDALYEQVTQALIDEGIVDSQQAAYYMYYNGGLNIEATVNPKVQEAINYVYSLPYGSEESPFPDMTSEYEYIDENGEVQVMEEYTQSAMVVINVEDGSVAGIVGGVGEKDASLVLNRAFSPRPIGSTMKGLAAYPLALEYGLIHYSLMLLDAPIMSRDPANPKIDANTGQVIFDWPYNVNEYGKVNNVLVPVCDAVAKSLNTVAARIGSYLGAENMLEFVRDSLMVSTLVEDGPVNDNSLAPMVLGSLTQGISVYELAAAYAIYGNGGVYNKPYLFTEITDANGNLILKVRQERVQAVSEETAFIMNRLLKNVFGSSGSANGTAKGSAPEYLDAIGKTGTTDDNKDKVFVGVTPYYAAAVWWGYDHNGEIENPPRGTENPPLKAWKMVMDMIQEDLPEKTFPEMPEGVTEAKFCRDTGLLAGAGCTNTQTGYYQNNYMPDVCDGHQATE